MWNYIQAKKKKKNTPAPLYTTRLTVNIVTNEHKGKKKEKDNDRQFTTSHPGHAWQKQPS